SCLISYARTDGIGIGFFANQRDAEPMVFGSDVVAQEERGVVIHGNENVDGAVIVEIADGKAASREGLGEDGAALSTNVGPCLTRVVKQEQWFAIADLVVGELFDQIVWIAVGKEKVEIAVVVVVEELEAPAAHQASRCADAG